MSTKAPVQVLLKVVAREYINFGTTSNPNIKPIIEGFHIKIRRPGRAAQVLTISRGRVGEDRFLRLHRETQQGGNVSVELANELAKFGS